MAARVITLSASRITTFALASNAAGSGWATELVFDFNVFDQNVFGNGNFIRQITIPASQDTTIRLKASE